MRVAMLHVDLPPDSRGGVAHQVSRLADALGRRGHEVVVFTLSDRPSDASYGVRGVPLVGLRTSRGWRMLAVPLGYGMASYSGFDVIHAHGDSHFVIGRNAPVVRTFYGSARDEARTASSLKRCLAQRIHSVEEQLARRLATVTVGISETTQSSVGYLDRIVPCGVDLGRFRPGTKSAIPSILFVGTLGGRKRGALLVEQFRTTVRAAMPESELWLVCDEDVDAEGVRTWRRPNDEQLARLYREAWLYASPSLYEGFGVPYLEALASGTPVVASRNEGAQELLIGGSGGLLVSDMELGQTLLALLRESARRSELATLGRRYSERFGWDNVTVAYEWVYELGLARERGERI